MKSTHMKAHCNEMLLIEFKMENFGPLRKFLAAK